MVPTAPTPAQLTSFPTDLHGERPDGLAPLAGGYWSSAYASRVGARELVLRLETVAEVLERGPCR